MDFFPHHGLSARAAIAIAFTLACALVHAALESAAKLTPPGAQLPTFTLEESTDFDALRDAWGRRMDSTLIKARPLTPRLHREASGRAYARIITCLSP